ncbi:MAG: ABC-2 family transporter protein [Anaerolineae bacterium]|nr:ABC-2 family transporter protein [Anaerolineae bacterium]
MRRYLRVLATFYKAAFLADLEYRANFVSSLVLSLVALGWSVAGAVVFFQHTDQLGGWSLNELLIVLGLFVFFLGFVDVFISPNVQDFMEHIRVGTMDFILLKPINAQFHTSLRRLNVWRLADMVLGIALVLWAISQLETRPQPLTVLYFIILCLCALLILYSLIMLLITSAFWFVQLENIMELLFTFYEAGRFPVTIFPGWVRVILTFVVPIAFITTVPASVLLARLDGLFVVYAAGIAAALFIACILFWNYAIRHYSSASS